MSWGGEFCILGLFGIHWGEDVIYIFIGEGELVLKAPNTKALCSSFQPGMRWTVQSFWEEFPFPKILLNKFKGTLPLDRHELTVSFALWSVPLTTHPQKAMFYEYFPSPLHFFFAHCLRDVLCSHGFKQPPDAHGAKDHVSIHKLAPWPSCKMPSGNLPSLGRLTDNTNLACLKLNPSTLSTSNFSLHFLFRLMASPFTLENHESYVDNLYLLGPWVLPRLPQAHVWCGASLCLPPAPGLHSVQTFLTSLPSTSAPSGWPSSW